ncbi:hypothetical protein PMAYCL1PPCAC_26549 [Pristionchus mayeri]|uniref:ShK domain-containing protein n=1 Tax=Pristionchus mayeri TaxID=1317129 RepID=A0AAN5I9E6_9BILA|nr:hypothetical protein PMAYCL1PPCAC_26549 [Pristionchus mayeri]
MQPLLLLIILLSNSIILVSSNCYDNWSRCTPQTSFWTGILWKSCPVYCRRCKGRESGGCAKVKNKECSGGYQCRCKGGNVKPSDNWLVKQTCKLGL